MPTACSAGAAHLRQLHGCGLRHAVSTLRLTCPSCPGHSPQPFEATTPKLGVFEGDSCSLLCNYQWIPPITATVLSCARCDARCPPVSKVGLECLETSSRCCSHCSRDRSPSGVRRCPRRPWMLAYNLQKKQLHATCKGSIRSPLQQCLLWELVLQASEPKVAVTRHPLRWASQVSACK